MHGRIKPNSWEQRKLSDSVTYRNGKAHESYIAKDGKYIVVNSKFVSTSGDVEKFSNIQIEPLYKGEIAFVLSDVPNGRALARTYLIENNDKYTLNQRIAGLTPNYEMDNYFLYILLNRNSYFLSFDDGAKQTNLSISDVLNFEFKAPCKNEQNKIGNLFKDLDSLITLHQRKDFYIFNVQEGIQNENFQNHHFYSLMMQESLNTHSWEQRKAKELCSITTGKSNTQDQSDEGIYPFFIRSDIPVKSKKYLYDQEAVITIGDGNIGKVFHYVNGKFDLHQRCYKMADFKHISAKYFYWYFSTKFYKRAISMTAKATVDSVRLEMISEMDIKYPCNSREQNLIQSFLFNIDNLITLHQRE